MKNPLGAVVLTSVLGLAACGGASQNYYQGLENNHRNFERHQAVLDEQNVIEMNKLKAMQREQEVQASRAEGQKAQAQAAGEAQATIERAKGEAEANQLIARSLTKEFVQYEWIKRLGDKSVIYLPSNVLPIMNMGNR